MAIIYKATNKINGLIYIGSTSKGLYKRKQGHKNNNRCVDFKEAINYYGFDAFIWEIVYVSDDLYDIKKKEDYYIEKYESYKPEFGYNLIKSGGIPNEKTKQKMSKSMKGKIGNQHNDEWKKNHSIMLKGHICTSETKKKISEAHKGKIKSEEHKRKLSIANKGKKFSEETKEKLSRSHKGKIPWNKGKIGKKHSEETKQKMRIKAIIREERKRKENE